MAGIGPSPRFFQQPLRYLHWASVNKPAYFFSIIVGLTGPVLVLTVPPVRRYMGEEQIAKIPMTYPGTYASLGEEGLARWESAMGAWTNDCRRVAMYNRLFGFGEQYCGNEEIGIVWSTELTLNSTKGTAIDTNWVR